jgi:hypothetical protein
MRLSSGKAGRQTSVEANQFVGPLEHLGRGCFVPGERAMLGLFHERLLSGEISERWMYLYSISHLKAAFTKLFSCTEKAALVQLKSATVVDR